MRQFDFLPSFLFLHLPLPLSNFKLDSLKVDFWFFINGLDNVYPATGTGNVPSVAPSKGQVSRRMGRFAATVGSRKRRRKAMGFIF